MPAGNQAEDGVKMLEITRNKQIVWRYHNPAVKWAHTVHVLSTNGHPEALPQSQLPQQ